MSKGNMLLGHARGKVGSLVFSRANGQQITRARAEVVKNPQTDAQVIQRILLNTIAQAYSRLSAICDHSFEGVKAGQDSMSYFMKYNLNAIRAKLATQGTLETDQVHVCPIGQSFMTSNDYLLSKGSLPVINPNTVANNGLTWNIGSGSYNAVLNMYGLQRGDQITFCVIKQDEKGVVTFKYARIILDPREDDGTEAALTEQLFTAGTVNKPNPKNEVADFSFSSTGDLYLISAGGDTIAGCIIASRQKEDGTWMRSNSSMRVNSLKVVGMSVAAALADFRSGGLDVTNQRFLNNATSGGATVSGGNTGGGGSNEPVVYNIVVTSQNNSWGTVAGGGEVNRGSSVTLTATIGSADTFAGWYEGNTKLSTANPYTFTPERSMNIQGRFTVISGD